MALFKFRKGREEQPASVAPAQTVEAVRRRAMHRLIGAAVLVLAGVIGFPLIFDNQPRPIPVDLPIEIVDRNKVKPLVMPPATANSAAAAAVTSAPVPAAPAAPAAKPALAEVPTAATAKEPDPEPKPAAVAVPAPAAVAAPASVKPAASAVDAAAAKALDAQKARALLEGRPVNSSKTAVAAAPGTSAPAASTKPAPESEDRFVVQVGAFANPAKAREVRQKVESAGLKTYTQVVKTSEGERTRVRVGPFTDKAQATKAADKIRKLNLSVAILTL
ncbi:MAG TPA: SPOR domain-containing protein [Burkholderiaceae bacterium]|nr:SPOR domain-containing protein [Burkholderiaceae bacterium]